MFHQRSIKKPSPSLHMEMTERRYETKHASPSWIDPSGLQISVADLALYRREVRKESFRGILELVGLSIFSSCVGFC